MTAHLTVNRACTRCPRIEQTEVSVEEIVKLAKQQGSKVVIPEGPKALSIRIDEKTMIEFEFLCGPCTQIVARYIEHIVRKPEKQSALRSQTKIEVEEDGEVEEDSE